VAKHPQNYEQLYHQQVNKSPNNRAGPNHQYRDGYQRIQQKKAGPPVEEAGINAVSPQ
jgi:hypothetical protein|tara:strand:+ start:73 stop:246 length:174 start_codon:yes stop_codon:yes gene_type:complete